MPNEHEPGIINPRLMRISLDSTKVNSEFVKIFLEPPKLQSLLERRSHGGTMPGLNAEAIASIKVPVPDLEFQDYAVKALALWDTAIEKTEALIDAKERQFVWLVGQSYIQAVRKIRFRNITIIEIYRYDCAYPW